MAHMLNPRTQTLLNENNRISQEDRDKLLLEVGVLNHFLFSQQEE